MPRRHLFRPPALLVAQPKPLLGGVEQGAQELAFPFGPGGRPDRPDIDHGQDQQQPQPLGALHEADEIIDCLGIGQVAAKGGMRK